MTSNQDTTGLPEEPGETQPLRLTRRKASVRLAATACVSALGLARLVSGQVKNGTATPMAMASPGASPAASPGASPAASPAASVAGTAHVSILNFSFMPASITVPVGTTVIWTNNDDIPHTVTSDDHTVLASGALDTGEMYTHRFSTAGTYPYFCSFHPFMTAKVIVK